MDLRPPAGFAGACGGLDPEVADAFGYFRLDEELAARLHRVIGTLVKVIRG